MRVIAASRVLSNCTTGASRQRPSSLSRPSNSYVAAPRFLARVPQTPVRARRAFQVAAAIGAGPSTSKRVDFYDILGVEQAATPKEIKRAYYAMAKECHPDISGDEGHDMCVLLNDAYETLSNPVTRLHYDEQRAVELLNEEEGFTGQLRSKWGAWVPAGETRAVFVDEVACIGCKNCIFIAPACFRLEPEYGRSYVFAQWLNKEDDIQAAIDSCPVSCIHWVQKEELPVLEHVMAKVERLNVGIMSAGQGYKASPFDAAVTFTKRRAEMEREHAKTQRRARETAAQREARETAAERIRQTQQARWGSWGAGLSGTSKDGKGASGPRGGALVPVSFYVDDKAKANKDYVGF